MFDKNTLQNLTDTEIGVAIVELKKELDERAYKCEEEEKKSASEFEKVIASAAANGIHYYIRANCDDIFLEDYPIYCSIR